MEVNSVRLIRLKSFPEINQYKAWYIKTAKGNS